MSYNSDTSCVIMGALAPEVSSCFGTRLIKNIGPSDKLHSALGKYPIMHQFVTEMCTHVHILLQYGALWDMEPVYCGICATGLMGEWAG